jgi:hypothetical protein
LADTAKFAIKALTLMPATIDRNVESDRPGVGVRLL